MTTVRSVKNGDRRKIDVFRAPYQSEILSCILAICPERRRLSRPYKHLHRRSPDQCGIWSWQSALRLDLQCISDWVRRLSDSGGLACRALWATTCAYPGRTVVGCRDSPHSPVTLGHLTRRD